MSKMNDKGFRQGDPFNMRNESIKKNLERGKKALVMLLKHENMIALRQTIYKIILEIRRKLAPLFRIATWTAILKHPKTQEARRKAMQVFKMFGFALKHVASNLLTLLWYSKEYIVNRYMPADKKTEFHYDFSLLRGLVR